MLDILIVLIAYFVNMILLGFVGYYTTLAYFEIQELRQYFNELEFNFIQTSLFIVAILLWSKLLSIISLLIVMIYFKVSGLKFKESIRCVDRTLNTFGQLKNSYPKTLIIIFTLKLISLVASISNTLLLFYINIRFNMITQNSDTQITTKTQSYLKLARNYSLISTIVYITNFVLVFFITRINTKDDKMCELNKNKPQEAQETQN